MAGAAEMKAFISDKNVGDTRKETEARGRRKSNKSPYLQRYSGASLLFNSVEVRCLNTFEYLGQDPCISWS